MGVESIQWVEFINGILKKHLDRKTLLKELVKVVKNELEKEVSTYNTIFKNIDFILKNHLALILLSLQRAQMKQALLYQGILIIINQVKESDNEPNDIIECIYNKSQIKLQDFLLNIDNNKIQEL